LEAFKSEDGLGHGGESKPSICPVTTFTRASLQIPRPHWGAREEWICDLGIICGFPLLTVITTFDRKLTTSEFLVMPVIGLEKAGSCLAPLAQLAWDYRSSLLLPSADAPPGMASGSTCHWEFTCFGEGFCGSHIDGQMICGLLSS